MLDKIIILLKQNKKTQKELCAYIGVPSNLFSEWKSGRNKSYTKYVSQIADYFNVSTDYLLGINSDQKEKPTDPEADKQIETIIESLKKLSPEYREEALRHIYFLVSEKERKDN